MALEYYLRNGTPTDMVSAFSQREKNHRVGETEIICPSIIVWMILWCVRLPIELWNRLTKSKAWVPTTSIRISTVFLAMNHEWDSTKPPLIFETMAFPNNEWCEIDSNRYSTEQEAIAGHESMVQKYKSRSTREWLNFKS